MSTSTIEAEQILLFFGEEVTYGVDPGLAEANALEVDDFEWDDEVVEIARNLVKHTFASPGIHIGSINTTINFKLPFAAFDPSVDTTTTNWTEPQYDSLLKACGMSSTASASGSFTDTFTYAFDSTDTTSLTFYVQIKQIDGSYDRYKILGARGVWTLSVEDDGILYWNFSFQGLFGGVPAAAVITEGSISYGNAPQRIDASPANGITFTLGGTSIDVSNFTITPNRALRLIKSRLATYGIGCVQIGADAGSSHMLEADPQLRLAADYDHWTKILAETREALQIITDTVKGARLTIDAPKAMHGNFGIEMDAIMRRSQTWYLADDETSTAGDDALILTVTQTPP